MHACVYKSKVQVHGAMRARNSTLKTALVSERVATVLKMHYVLYNVLYYTIVYTILTAITGNYTVYKTKQNKKTAGL